MRKIIVIIVLSCFSLATQALDEVPNSQNKRRTNLMSALEASMAYALQRQMVLSQNISAQNVPGYHTKDLKKVNFNKPEVLKDRNIISAKVTNVAHIQTRPNKRNYKVREEKFDENTSIMKNNVNIADEMVKVTENSASYNLSTTLFKKSAGLMKMAIQ